MACPSLKVRAKEARIIIPAESMSARAIAPTIITGTARRGRLKLMDSVSPRRGARMAPRETKIARTFNTPAETPMVATYRYLAVTTLAREAEVVMRVSQVDLSRS